MVVLPRYYDNGATDDLELRRSTLADIKRNSEAAQLIVRELNFTIIGDCAVVQRLEDMELWL